MRANHTNHEKEMNSYSESDAGAEEFAERVRSNQHKLISDLKSHYDFIVCGSGFSGSVVARRLAENPEVTVLLKLVAPMRPTWLTQTPAPSREDKRMSARQLGMCFRLRSGTCGVI
jgi:hypothetical protein